MSYQAGIDSEQTALTLKGVWFPQPGIYLVELFCEAQ
jgi:hypothetical protein